MKLLMLVYSGPTPARIAALLDAHDAGGYTELSNVHGAGSTGRLLGTRAWPGSATVFMSAVPVARADDLVAALRTYKAAAAEGEHLHVAVMPIESYF